MKTNSPSPARRSACTYMLVALLGAFAAGCMYVDGVGRTGHSRQAQATRSSSGEIPSDLEWLEIDNSFGLIRVLAVENEPAEWSWNLTIRANTEAQAQQWADAASCNESRNGGTMRLAAAFPDTSGAIGIQSEFEVRLPKSVSIRARNQFGRTEIIGIAGEAEISGRNGAIELRDISGNARGETTFAPLTAENVGPAWLKNQHGRITARAVRGSLEAATSFGRLEVRDVSGDLKVKNQNGSVEIAEVAGDAEIKTSFGALRVERVKGDAYLANQHGLIEARQISGSVKAATSFGRIEVESAGPRVECHNQNGSIWLQATSPQLAGIHAQTSFGRLEVHLPASLVPAIEAQTSFAAIESDFPVLMPPKSEDAFARLEPGTPAIRLRNQNGAIRIVRENAVPRGR